MPNMRWPDMKWAARATAILAAVLTLTGCPSLGPRAEAPPSVDRARSLDRSGDYSGAARTYEQLAAQNTGTEQNAYLLLAARAWLQARRPDDAQRVLAAIAPPLAPDQTFERQMLGVELALARNQFNEAWQQISAVQQPGAAPAVTRYLTLRQHAAFGISRPVDGVRAEVVRERFVANPEERAQNRAELLEELRGSSERGVRIDSRGITDSVIRGWLELAPLAAAAARNPASATPDIEAWRTRYPNHPANDVVRTELLGLKQAPPPQSLPHVALLLPLSGRNAAAGISVRDGFMTAYYQVPTSQRPRLRIFDTAEISAAEAITRARQEGAEFIIGPLTRDEVTAAADLGEARPPILALNFLASERPGPAGFYQFALSPEEEARQVARRVLAEDRRHGVALVPEGEWGARVLAAFRQELEAGGGALLADVALDSTRTDWAPEIQQVLRLNDSMSRHKRLESVLGTKLQFEPRRRADIDFVFAPAPFATARLVRPQLRYHFAGDIPTYSTSDAFEPDATGTEDMEGLIFPDMPWMLGSDLADGVRSAARDAWPSGGPRRNRLYAFGFDAFRLAMALRSTGAGGNVNVDGLTGRLTLDPERRVHRELAWAQLHNGQTRPLAIAAAQ